jgi:hypothetical protein
MLLLKIASYLFHPLFMTLFGVFIIFNAGIYATNVPHQYYQFVYTMVILCNILLPLTLIAGLILFRKIKNSVIDDKQDRLMPLIFATFCFYSSYFEVSKYSSSAIINLFLGATVIVLAAVLIITIFWKISMHMAGIGGITGLTLFLIYFYNADIIFVLCAVILISGIVSSSRLASGSHTILQLIGGYFLGLILVFSFLMRIAY